MDQVEARIRLLAQQLLSGLMEIPNVTMLTPSEEASRAGMVSFKLKHLDYRDFGKKAAAEKFRIRLVPESGLEGIRISTHLFNSPGEVDAFLELVNRV